MNVVLKDKYISSHFFNDIILLAAVLSIQNSTHASPRYVHLSLYQTSKTQ